MYFCMIVYNYTFCVNTKYKKEQSHFSYDCSNTNNKYFTILQKKKDFLYALGSPSKYLVMNFAYRVCVLSRSVESDSL